MYNLKLHSFQVSDKHDSSNEHTIFVLAGKFPKKEFVNKVTIAMHKFKAKDRSLK